MYKAFRAFCERLLRIPAAPGAPPGDESTTRVFRASPNFFKYLAVIWAVQTGGLLLPMLTVAAIFIAVSMSVKSRSSISTATVVVIGIVVLTLFLIQRLFRLALLRLDYEKRWYVVTDRSLRVREGVLAVQEMTVTFANIQNLSISQGPIQRMLKVADLRVDTAGGGGASGHSSHSGHELHTAWFRGIDNADEVRLLIQGRLRHLKDSGLGDQEEVMDHRQSAPDLNVIVALREVYQESRDLRACVERSTSGAI